MSEPPFHALKPFHAPGQEEDPFGCESEADVIRKPAGFLQSLPDPRLMHGVVWTYLLFAIVSALAWNTTWGVGLFAVSRAAVWERAEYWRLLTALFVHADIAHLLANGPLFIIFGWYLRSYFGRLAFPWVPILIGVLANLITIASYPAETTLLGASGMLYGMVALWIVFYVAFEVRYGIGMRIFRAVGFSMLVLFPTTFHLEVSYLAHAAGFGVGVLMACLLLPWVARRVRAHQLLAGKPR